MARNYRVNQKIHNGCEELLKQNPAKQQLNDRGKVRPVGDETHIGIKNPSDLPVVRGRPHGDGT